MFILSDLLTLAARLRGEQAAFALTLARTLRWRNFDAEFYLLPHLVPPGLSAIDVGGNEGFYAGRLAQLTNRVHCFEPNPALAASLRRKLPAHVTVHEAALSDAPGQATLRVPYAGAAALHGTATLEPANALPGADRIETITCTLHRLDDVVQDPVGFIKIDVEGHEHAVLRGATRILSQHRPTLLIESEKRHNPAAPESIFALLHEYGYEAMVLLNGTLRAASGFNAARDQDPASMGLPGRPYAVKPGRRYVNNFIFLAPLA